MIDSLLYYISNPKLDSVKSGIIAQTDSIVPIPINHRYRLDTNLKMYFNEKHKNKLRNYVCLFPDTIQTQKNNIFIPYKNINYISSWRFDVGRSVTILIALAFIVSIVALGILVIVVLSGGI